MFDETTEEENSDAVADGAPVLTDTAMPETGTPDAGPADPVVCAAA